MVILLIVAIAIVLYIFLKPYFFRYDTVICFTGGLGSGKTFLSVETAKNLLSRNRLSVCCYNFFHPKHKKETPCLFSNIPIRISRKEWSSQLTSDMLLLRHHLPEKSVVLLDEVDAFANQFEYKNPNLCRSSDEDGSGAFDEFVRLFRHYTKGGYLVCNTQCSENIVLTIRRRLNTCFNLMDFKVHFNLPLLPVKIPILYTVRCRNISLSEEIKTVVDKQLEDGFSVRYGFMPFRKSYDTYCYSERYNTTPVKPFNDWTKLKTNALINCPSETVKKLTSSVELK